MPDHNSDIGHGLTLDLSGAEVPAEKFAEGVQAFLGLLNEVAKTVSGKPRSIRWVVTVRPGSVIVDFSPRPLKIACTDLPPILDTVENGIVATEAGASQPPGFSDRALDYASRLAAILDGKDRELDRVRIWRAGTPHDVTLRTVAYVDALSGIEARDWGTLEGTLVTITDQRGGLEFYIRDTITGRRTRCYFEEDMLDDVMDAFRHRVAASGVIRYKRNGEPVSIKVEEFTAFPRSEELPSFEDVRGILGGASE